MSSSRDIYVTPSTSLVLIKNLSSLTNIYLSSLYTNNFTVSIRDTTGLSSLQTTPVRISTIGGARFQDGTSLYLLNQPYGFLNLSLRNSTIWQVLHTSGQPVTSAAANLSNLTVSTLYTSVLSTLQKFTSTLVVQTITSPTALSLTIPFVLTTLSTPGFAQFQSTLDVYGTTTVDGNLTVSGATQIASSVNVSQLLPLSSILSISTSLGIGGVLQVGGTTTLASTVGSLSTLQLLTLDVQGSTSATAVLIQNTYTEAGLLSTLSGMTVGVLTSVGRNMTVQQNVSSFAGSWQTSSLFADGGAKLQGVSTSGTARFLSTLTFVESLQTFGSTVFLSTTGIGGSFSASSFSTARLSTFGSLSTGSLNLSTATLQGSLSTVTLTAQSLSTGGSFLTPANVSSLGLLRIGGDWRVQGNVWTDAVHTSSCLDAREGLSVRNTVYAGSASIYTNASTAGISTLGATHVQDSMGIAGNMFLDGTLYVNGTSVISSFLVNSFLLSNLEILTSSPFTSFTASSLNGSTIQTDATRIYRTTEYLTSSTYASSTQILAAATYGLQGTRGYAGAVRFGDLTSIDSANPKFGLNVVSQFPRGLSTVSLRVQTMTASTMQARFIGDGFLLSNVNVPFPNLSAIQVTASSIVAQQLYTCTITASSFTTATYANIFSTLITPTLVIESQGFPIKSSINQFLVVNPRKMVINQNLWFDLPSSVGINLSSPQYSLDISGTVYANNVLYSSINAIFLSSPGTTMFSTIQASSIFARDGILIPPSGLQINTSRFGVAEGSPFLFYESEQEIGNTFGLFRYPSSISLNNTLRVYQSTGYVSLNSGTVPPTVPLKIADSGQTTVLNVSSLHINPTLQSQSLITPNLFFNSLSTQRVHTIQNSTSNLVIDSFVWLTKGTTEADQCVGIGTTTTPIANLDVRGTVFFSTFAARESTRANVWSLTSENL